ncbi:glycosyltransferase family 2 protein [Jidongwangia harbinensis]|uniref:glycosyltransferase family 2 protein n=1 Tax=Jidongwangia harbinensis TaxID=2878561 RepID=UPI001CDA2C06|nr:glycosyltransferase [Jidongwangia harbinensis]MCA2211329.1 glycosyltransferase [Jidongwangia harbinensis]
MARASHDVTVFVPARNEQRTLARCLAAVAASTVRPARVVVLDDRSTDRTARIARAAGAEVVQVPGAGGLGVARSLALDSCTTRYLAFLNADCYPEPDWLDTLLPVLADGAAVAGGRQEELRAETLAERWKAVHLRQDRGTTDLDDPDHLSGGNLLLDVTRLAGVRFDPRYTIAYEDVDFCRRLRAAGGRLAYRPAAVVWHDHRETLRTLPRKVWSYGAFSHAVNAGSPGVGPVRAALRMHRRPHDQIRTAIGADLRARRPAFLAVDLFLLIASVSLFVVHGRGSTAAPAAGPAAPTDRPSREERQ